MQRIGRFSMLAVVLVLFVAGCAAQHTNTYFTSTFTNYSTQGGRVGAAQAQCSADKAIWCVIHIDPDTAKLALGTMPARCANCTWMDWRNGGSIPNPIGDVISSATPWRDVRAYGAVCDGATDDTFHIQAAIDAAAAAGGGSVFIPWTGQQCVADGIKIKTGVSLRGPHRKILVLKHKANATNPLIMLASASQVLWGIYDLGMDGNRSNQANPRDGIHIDGGNFGLTHRSAIVNVDVLNESGNGVYLTESAGGGGAIDMIAVNANNNGQSGIWMGIDDTYCVRCEASQNTGNGFTLETAGNLHLTDTKSWMNGAAGYTLHAASGAVLTGIESQSNGYQGLYVKSCQDVIASNMHLEDDGTAGLLLDNVNRSRFSGSIIKSHNFGVAYNLPGFGTSQNNQIDVITRANASGDYDTNNMPDATNFMRINQSVVNGAPTSNVLLSNQIANTGGADMYVGTTSSNSLYFKTNGGTRWGVSAGGDFYPPIDNSVNVGSQSYRPKFVYGYSGDFTTGMKILGLKSTTGTRFICIDAVGQLVSSATACSGT